MTYNIFFTILSISVLLFSCNDNQQKETYQKEIKVEEITEKKLNSPLEKVTADWETATKEFKRIVYNAYSGKIEVYDADGNEIIKTVEFPINKEKKQELLIIMKKILINNKSAIAKFKNSISEKDLEDEIVRTVMNDATLIKCEKFIDTFEQLSVESKKNQQQMLILINGLYTQEDIMSPRDLSALIQNFIMPKIEHM